MKIDGTLVVSSSPRALPHHHLMQSPPIRKSKYILTSLTEPFHNDSTCTLPMGCMQLRLWYEAKCADVTTHKLVAHAAYQANVHAQLDRSWQSHLSSTPHCCVYTCLAAQQLHVDLSTSHFQFTTWWSFSINVLRRLPQQGSWHQHWTAWYFKITYYKFYLQKLITIIFT